MYEWRGGGMCEESLRGLLVQQGAFKVSRPVAASLSSVCVCVGGSVSVGERERERRGSGLGESGSVYEC